MHAWAFRTRLRRAAFGWKGSKLAIERCQRHGAAVVSSGPQPQAGVHPDEAKARKAIPVPLNGEAMSILQKQIGKHRDHMFTFKGQPVEQLSTAAWYKALKRAGIENFRWHDLRHTWASWHVHSGTTWRPGPSAWRGRAQIAAQIRHNRRGTTTTK